MRLSLPPCLCPSLMVSTFPSVLSSLTLPLPTFSSPSPPLPFTLLISHPVSPLSLPSSSRARLQPCCFQSFLLSLVTIDPFVLYRILPFLLGITVLDIISCLLTRTSLVLLVDLPLIDIPGNPLSTTHPSSRDLLCVTSNCAFDSTGFDSAVITLF